MEKSGFTLLIIEPNKTLAGEIAALTSGLFNNHVIEEDGARAIDKFKESAPDLVITNITNPSLSGHELLKSLKKANKWVRIIAYGEIDAADLVTGAPQQNVKGFLATPVNHNHLLNLVQQQLHKIERYRSNKIEENKRISVESDYDKSRRILQVISETTSLFFRSGFHAKNINKVLRLIGEVTEASRVYIYKNYSENGEDYTSRIYEWTADGIMPAIGNLSVTNKHIASSGFAHWVKIMKTDRSYISGLLRDFNLTEQKRFSEHGIKSLLAIPIFVEDHWWGFIGLDDCLNERTWMDAEISALEVLANNIGLAILRSIADQELLELNKELEKKIKERTRDLEFEVAERSMAEALLKDSEEKYRLIYENATYGIMLVQKKRIVLVNPALVEIMEELPRNLIGKKFSRIIAKEDRLEVKRQFGSIERDHTDNVFNVKIRTGKSTYKWLELKPARIDWYGEPAHLVFVANISARIKAELELKQLNVNLKHKIKEEVSRIELQKQLLVQKSKLESLGELSAGLAHEINQPLVSISMGLDNILMTMNNPECDTAYIKNKINLLFKDIDRIKDIIEHVRIFSRGQSNRKNEKVRIDKVIDDAMSLTKKMLEDENIKLTLKYHPGHIFVLGNRHRLEQVVLNLISNARFAVNEKQRKVGNDGYIKQIEISCSKIGNKLILEIKDNGIGIPPEILTNIFNPFFTTKSETKGTGLGLSISYGIINEMNGEITAESMLNEFTRMKIHLPVHTKD